MSIIAGSLEEIVQALQLQGFLFLVDVKWIRQPSRVNGRWRCEVMP
ncbi:hypothetical protein [Pseudomonas sp. MWU12-2345]|nr:hypothetical protein [Pseudomonas sp. MWU12-2345]